jgi:Phage integrase, N-terminal SAM-like domain
VQTVRPSTLVGYRGYVRNRIIPTIGRHRIDKLRPEHLERFYDELIAEGLSPATIRQVHRITSRARDLSSAGPPDRICTAVPRTGDREHLGSTWMENR